MTDCLFCKIAAGNIPCNKVYEDEDFLAFHDINPKAPVHVLVIPRHHLPSLNDADDQDVGLLGLLMDTTRRVARELGVDDPGYLDSSGKSIVLPPDVTSAVNSVFS